MVKYLNIWPAANHTLTHQVAPTSSTLLHGGRCCENWKSWVAVRCSHRREELFQFNRCTSKYIFCCSCSPIKHSGLILGGRGGLFFSLCSPSSLHQSGGKQGSLQREQGELSTFSGWLLLSPLPSPPLPPTPPSATPLFFKRCLSMQMAAHSSLEIPLLCRSNRAGGMELFPAAHMASTG